MTAKIYRPAKTATQSGQAKTGRWVLEMEAEKPRSIDPLMGWTSSADTRTQVKLSFATREDAIAYAQRKGLAYIVVEPHEPARRPMAYSDNFKSNRVGQWTH